MVFDYQNEDLFEDTKMSFGEHLEELRGVLVRALIGLGIGFAIALMVANHVVAFLQTPLKKAIREFTIQQAQERLKKENDGIIPPELEQRLTVDQLTPKKLKITPGKLAELLEPTLGEEALANLTIPEPYAFKANQIKPGKIAELCSLLAGDDNEADQPSATETIRQYISSEDQASLEALADFDEPTAKDRRTIRDILRRAIDSRAFYQEEAFQKLYEGKVERNGWRRWMPFQVDENTERSKALQKFRDALDEENNEETLRRLNNWLLSLSLNEYLNEPTIELEEIQVWESTEINPQALNAHEVFMIYLKASLIVGLLISSPWVFFQIWSFIAAGLYPHERNYVYIYVPFSIGLFLGGACLAYFFVFEPVLNFLFSFNAAMGIDPQPRIGEWLSFVLFLPIGFGVAFQLPLVMLFLNRIGIVSITLYIEKWRIAILIISFLSMILTPADPISMILLGAPLTVLYFFGIGLCKWMPKGRNPFSESYEPS